MKHFYCRTGTAFNRPRHMEKCLCQRLAWQHTTWLQIKQRRIDAPAGTIHPTRQLLVRDAHSAAESVLPSSACAVIYEVMSHVYISNTPSSTNVIVELDGLQASKQASKQASPALCASFLQKKERQKTLINFNVGD